MREASDAKDITQDLPLNVLLELAGDVTGLRVLDVGCGEGYVSRILAERGARVTGIDISDGLIEIARAKDPDRSIDFQVHDLSKPLPQFEQSFDLVVGNFIINDVPDYLGFATTLGGVTRKGGRLVLSGNNPYSAVRREKVKNYFDSGTSVAYQGMANTTGIKAFYYHRTLEEYIRAFRENGFLVGNLSDVCPPPEMFDRDDVHAEAWYRFPSFMVLEFLRQ